MDEDQLAAAFRARLDELFTTAPLLHPPAPPRSDRLTLDDLYRAHDRVVYTPEPCWYLCHPDDLAAVRATVGQAAAGKHTCPLVRASKACPPGKIVQIAIDYDLLWPSTLAANSRQRRYFSSVVCPSHSSG